jgi:hypothetical protein
VSGTTARGTNDDLGIARFERSDTADGKGENPDRLAGRRPVSRLSQGPRASFRRINAGNAGCP